MNMTPAFKWTLIIGGIAFAALLASIPFTHADTIKQRPLSIKEMTLEAVRQAREQARDLRNSDMQAKIASGEISDIPVGPDPEPSSPSSSNSAGKR